MRYVTPGPEHAESLLLQVAAGFDGYRAIAPDGWAPPDTLTPEEVQRCRAALADPDAFALMAVHGSDPVAHVLWVPDEDEPGGAYLRQLFVLEPWWGASVAGELHARAIAAMRERGRPRARLLTPAVQARARRFYEREGWELAREMPDVRLGMPVAEYRRALG